VSVNELYLRSSTDSSSSRIFIRRYHDQIDALSADLDAAASEGVELKSQVSTLEQSLSNTKAQLNDERTCANHLQSTLTNANS
jgi:predicted  nucleic acid-binding Zn-ribbon protein